MKPTHRTLILAALIAATGLIIYHFTTSPNRNRAGEPGTPPPVEGEAESIVKTTHPEKENRVATTASNRPIPEVIPDGISTEQWQQATALFNMLASSNGEGIMFGALMKPKDIDALAKALGLDPNATAVLNKLIETRNEALKKTGRDQIALYKRDPATFKEKIALSSILEGKLSEQQKARLEQLQQLQKDDQKDFITANVPWYKDDSFLVSIHDTLPADKATVFDDYAGDQKQKMAEQMAFYHSQALGSNLELDDNQRQAIFEIYRKNSDAGSNEILPLLNESQQAKLKEHPKWSDWRN